jgi:hypothetical protein
VPTGRVAGILTAVAIGLAACGGDDDPTAGSGGGAVENAAGFTDDEVALGEALAQLRGHHRASLEAYEAGDRETALVHAFHPVEEIIDSVRSDLDPGTAEELSAVLDESTGMVHTDAPVDDLAEAYERAASLSEDALEASVGPGATEAKYVCSVAAALVNTASNEFEEAAPDGELVLSAEYQDGYAFIREAGSLVDPFASSQEAAEVTGRLADLEQLLPSLEPPESLPSTEEVDESAAAVVEGLAESFGATVPAATGPAEVAANIEDLLDEVQTAYEGGDAARASELAAEAYLENYEVIEAEVIELAPEINEDLEPLLGAELRRQIEEGASVEDIANLIAEARRLLAQAVEEIE